MGSKQSQVILCQLASIGASSSARALRVRAILLAVQPFTGRMAALRKKDFGLSFCGCKMAAGRKSEVRRNARCPHPFP